MATLSIGGDDIDFPGILFNCILETHLPTGGPPYRTCDDQRTHSWSLIRDLTLVSDISTLIGQIVTKGRAGQAGNNFKLYVTGYGQFFNSDTNACNDVTFARSANPTPDGKPHQMMTNAIRNEFNQMSLGLNAAIKTAVAQNSQNGVTYIDIDGALTGHRFCEEGINEPDQNNENLWLYHYPYNQPNLYAEIGPSTGPDYTSLITDAKNKVYGASSISQLSAQYPDTRSIDDAFYNAIDVNAWQALSGGVDAAGLWDGVVGARAKLFHPQIPFHTWIQNAIVTQWKQDRDIDSNGVSSAPPASSPTPAPAPPSRWSYTFHSYTGNLATGAFSFMVLPGIYNGDFGSSKRSLEDALEEREEAVARIPSHPHFRRLTDDLLGSNPPPIDELDKRARLSDALLGSNPQPIDDLDKRARISDNLLGSNPPPIDDLDKRACCPGQQPAPNPPITNAEVWVWTQNGDGATVKGPLTLDCHQGQDAWQGFSPSDTGLPLYLVLQSGHACAFDAADDHNLDNLHAKYGAQYLDVPTGVSNGGCSTHDNGVTCNTFTV